MNKVKIITDSCSDLNAEQLERYGIAYAKMTTVYKGRRLPRSLLGSMTRLKSYMISCVVGIE